MMTLGAGLHWLGLAMTAGALAASIGALLSRSLFSMCMHLAAAACMAAAALLAWSAGEAALALILCAAAWAPILLLGAMLLSARTAKSPRGGAPWFSALAALAGAAALFAALPELQPAPERAAFRDIGLGAWLAPLMLVAAAACVALVGYGERGALQRPPEGEP